MSNGTPHPGTREEFVFEGHRCVVYVPDTPAPGRPWIWRTEFLGAFDTVDRALVARGWHLVTVSLSDRYGCPSAVEDMHSFHGMVTERYALPAKAVMEGFSRGGLYACNYARRYPELVAGLYLDAPVLDIRSWPGGKGAGRCSPDCWVECLEIYGLTEETVKDFTDQPLDHAAEFARFPVLLIVGAADTDVPYAENGEPFARVLREQGCDLCVIVKPDCAHHPHSLEDPAPAVEFIESHMM